jgi:hypothetical protein
VVDLIGFAGGHCAAQRTHFKQIARDVFDLACNLGQVARLRCARRQIEADHLITVSEQQLSQIRAVLPSDSGY